MVKLPENWSSGKRARGKRTTVSYNADVISFSTSKSSWVAEIEQRVACGRAAWVGSEHEVFLQRDPDVKSVYLGSNSIASGDCEEPVNVYTLSSSLEHSVSE